MKALPTAAALLRRRTRRPGGSSPGASLLLGRLFSMAPPPLSVESEENDDDRLCHVADQRSSLPEDGPPPPVAAEESPPRVMNGEWIVQRAWEHWRRLGAPKLVVAPMVDNSELPFRMLCRKYGAEAAYTPMLHSRIFTENEKYRMTEFTTCKVRSNFLILLLIFGETCHGWVFHTRLGSRRTLVERSRHVHA